MTSHRRLIVVLSHALLFAAVVDAHGQQRVSREQIADLRTSEDVVIQRIGPRGVDTLRDDRSVLLGADELIVASRPEHHLRPFSVRLPDGARQIIPVPILAATREGVRELFVTVQMGDGLIYAPGEGAFVGAVHVGLEDAEHPHERFELTSPIQLQAIPLTGTVAPDLIEIGHTLVPLQRLEVADPAPHDSVGLRILYARQEPANVFLPVRRIPLSMSPRGAKIHGFGLESASFSVRLPSELKVDSLPIGFSTSMQPEPHTAFAAVGRPAVMKIRSRGIGLDTVRAEGPHFVLATTAPIEYAFPWLFIAASLLGGMIGAGLRVLTRRDRGSEPSGVVANLLAGVLLGLLVAVGYAVGVNLLPVDISGPPVEAVIFFVAGLGAFLGVSVLESHMPTLRTES